MNPEKALFVKSTEQGLEEEGLLTLVFLLSTIFKVPDPRSLNGESPVILRNKKITQVPFMSQFIRFNYLVLNFVERQCRIGWDKDLIRDSQDLNSSFWKDNKLLLEETQVSATRTPVETQDSEYLCTDESSDEEG